MFAYLQKCKLYCSNVYMHTNITTPTPFTISLIINGLRAFLLDANMQTCF